ncbi:MAG: alpha-amylase family glycosyl hydrolase, partial [Myxococcota bacterium]
DEHYGTLETYKNLSHELHSRGMYLIQDVVVNHTGNFFYYQNNEYNPSDPTQNFVRNENSVPTTAPVQAPFDRNNALNPDHLADEIYHFTPTIRDQGNDFEVENYQLADLDDLNTENPVVREALRDSFAYWIAEVGVDGFRLDTAKYVSHDYWNDFIHRGEGDGTPGMNAVAASTGRDDFFSFGEVFNGSAPFDDSGEQKVTSYLGTPDTPEISAVLNFPLHFTLNDVFAGGAATARLGYRIEKHIDTSLFRDPQRTPMFIDNHDVSRFLSKGSVAGLKQALVLMFSLPGIPIIYQGTEQGLSITRPAMFEGGWNPNNDADGDNVADSALFDRDAELYQHIRALTEMRKANAILTRGETSVLISSQAGPGLFALQRSLDGQDAYILFNTADEPILLAEFATSLPKGGKLELLIGEGVSGDIVVGDNGAFTVELDPRAFAVLVTTGEVEKVDAPELSLTIDTKLNGGQFSEDITIFG